MAVGVCLFAGYDHPWLDVVFILAWRGGQDYPGSPLIMARGICIHTTQGIVSVLVGGEALEGSV